MSIIIHFNTAPFIPAAAAVPSTPPCLSKGTAKLEMVPGIEHTDGAVMTDDENSMVDIATSNTLFTHTFKEEKATANHCLGSCFGLPYQDHNYGAPPPPTPPSYSPCPSPVHVNGIPDEDTNLSVVSTSTTNEETQEGSITRCICGFEHDDEYMICCDLCLVWQHVDCMGLDRSNIPETYLCEKCEPRKVDRHKAKALQARKKVAMTVKPPPPPPTTTTITATTKQEMPVNNQFIGKDCKRKLLSQSSSEWTCQKIDFQADSSSSAIQRCYYTSDSEEENTSKESERKPKTRSKRRKKDDDKNEEKPDQTLKRNKLIKHSKDRMEMKRSKLRKTKNKESTSTADEEAQDAWEYSLEWCEQNYESAVNNQYTSEIQLLARNLTAEGHEKRCFEQLQSRQPCRVIEGNKLVCVHDTPREQPLIEYKGKFLLASQFLEIHPVFNKRLYPYVLFYTLHQEEICVDASMYGNDARFVRRSCKPNAEIHHLVHNGNLHLYISSTKAIFKDDEVTIPLDLNQKDSFNDIECACGSDDCILKFSKKNGGIEACQEKKKKGRRATSSADDDSSHSFVGVSSSKLKSPGKNASAAHQTREERKIDAIMRAFDQMEKAEKRRQQALERQKAHQPKPEDLPEKPDNIIAVKEEEKPVVTIASETQIQCPEEEKPPIISTPKPKKGKRRRGSGNPSRRRTRTNSGCSDILSPEEVFPPKTVIVVSSSPTLSTDNVQTTTVMPPGNLPAANPILPTPSASPASPVILKTKRFLLHEWLQEKSEAPVNTTVTSPLSIHTEMRWNISAAAPTCYVRCTKDNPHSGGISAAHLRRSSTSGPMKAVPIKTDSGQGSAKKRWLRQAMYDCNSYEEQLTIDTGAMDGIPSLLESGCCNPNCHHGDINNSGVAPDDTITPLKKRRLMRESVESMPSPMSPPLSTCMEFPTTAISNSLNSELITESGMECHDQQFLCVVKCEPLPLSPSKTENTTCKINGLRMDVIESQKDTEYKGEEETVDSLPSASISLANISSAENANCSESLTCKTTESTMQTNCDPEFKVNGDIHRESVQLYNSLNSSQNNCSKPVMLLKSETVSFDASASSNSQSQVNLLTEEISSSESKICEPITDISNQGARISDEDIVKKENIFAQKQTHELSSAVSVNNISSLVKTDTCALISQTLISSSSDVSSVTDEGHLSSKSIESQDNNAVAKPLCNASSMNVCEGSKECSFGLTSVAPEQSSFISHESDNMHSLATVNNKQGSNTSDHNASSCVSLNHISSKTICSSEEICINTIPNNSLSSDCKSSVSVKSDELHEVEGKTPNVTNENPPHTTRATCASATQKRKVSLSEYRMRMRESAGKQSSNPDTMKKSMSAPAICATAIPETLPEQVTLAPLPLFDTTIGSRSPPRSSAKSSKKKRELKNTEEEGSSDIEHRENLTERLKREFGFNDDSEGTTLMSATHIQTKSMCAVQTSNNSNVPILPLCAQPPPPPPPPPPRPPRPSPATMSGATAASPSQFSYPVAPPYPRPSYIVTQVPGAQYISSQPPLATSVLAPVHQINPVGAQCNVRPPLLPSAHSFTPTLPGTVLRPQHEFASVNAQNFVALVQQPPPPPPPPPHKTYPHVYQPALYK